jgi:hypothetical protein
MPCDIGYKSVSKAKIEAPAPELIDTSALAPKIDADLLAKLGQEDPAFLGWIEELDTGPLLKKALENAVAAGASDLAARFQLEVLKIIGELLDFDLSFDGDVLEGEKATSGAVKEFLRIQFSDAKNVELRFEHFKSENALSLEEARFLALARKLGVRLSVFGRKTSGQDIPKGAVHFHPHKGKTKK